MRTIRARSIGDHSMITATVAGLIGIAFTGVSALAQPSGAQHALPQPRSVIIGPSFDKQKSQAAIRAAQVFYAFWETGHSGLADQVVARAFRDHMVAKHGRQGRDALEQAVARLHDAVPDLECTIEELLVVGDRVVARLTFSGTGSSMSPRGAATGRPAAGKPIKFTAIDILRVQDGQIVEGWREESHSSLLKRLERGDSTAKGAEGGGESAASAPDDNVLQFGSRTPR